MKTTFAHGRRLLPSPTLSLLALSLISAGIAPAAHAQTVSANSSIYQFKDDPSKFLNYIQTGCFASGGGAGLVVADASCSVDAIPGGSGTMLGHGITVFDPGAGTMKSLSSLSANNFTLAQFIPKFDPGTGDRIYSEGPRPDVVGARSSLSLNDRFMIHSTGGATPATISLFLDLDGTLRADAQPDGATSYASTFLNFCTAAAGICGTSAAATDAFFLNAGWNLDSDGIHNGFSTNAGAPAGSTVPSLAFDGSSSLTSISGRATISDIPIDVDTPLDFNFAFGTDVAFFHPTSPVGLLADGCDPDLDSSCARVDPVIVNGDAIADFYHTVMFAGFKVFDVNGNDITDEVTLTFASGLTPAAPGTVATPEPGTFVLMAGGLSVLGLRMRRRRVAVS